MATRMADTKVTSDNSGNQVRHSNPATHPLPPSAGLAVTVGKPASGATVTVHGQVSGVANIVIDNPA